MKQEADVGDGEAGDAADFFVAEAVLEFEANDFALIGWELFEGGPDVFEEFVAAGVFAGVWLPFVEPVEMAFVVGELQAMFASQDVECAIAADGVEPSFEVFADAVWVCEVEFEEGVLHDVAGAFFIAAEDAAGVGDEVAFV